MERYDIAVIGTGPAGLEAAITAKVRNKSVLLLGSKGSSDKVAKAHTIQNYLGLPDVPGDKMAQAFLDHAKSMGVEIMRLPVHFDLLMEPTYTGKIKESILKKLDEVCDWAEKYQIYLVIDNHSFNTEQWDNNPPPIDYYKEHLKAVWSQVAPRYRDRSEYIIFEIVNEPKTSQEFHNKWPKVQQEIINLIRDYDQNRMIVVAAADGGNADTFIKTKPYKDPNLIYTYHFYEPHFFTHQGATWIGPVFPDIKIPFPYEKSRLPKYKGETVTWNQLKQIAAKNDSWIQWAIETYPTEGTVKYINSRIKKVADWAKKNKVKIWCGEIGAKVWTNPEDRLAWIRATVSTLNKYDVPYCIWGIGGSDGFLKEDSETMIFPDDIDKDSVEAYGFAMPDEYLADKCNSSMKQFPQKSYLIYDGFTQKGASISMYGSVKSTTLYDSHRECIKASLSGDNNGFFFYLPQTIWEKVADNKEVYNISLFVKFSNNNQKFLIAIDDTDEGEAALPWAIEYEIRASDYKSGEWINIEIPLSKFYQAGAWSNKTQKYYPSEGKFDWTRLEKLEFHFNDYEKTMSGDIYIDDVVIKKK